MLGSFPHLMVPDAVSWKFADPCAASIAVSCSVKSFGNCISKNLGHKVAGRHGLAVVMLSCWVCSVFLEDEAAGTDLAVDVGTINWCISLLLEMHE